MNVLVTGAAGFIGMHVAQRLLDRGERVVGIDDLNPYYPPQLKRDRLARLLPHPAFRFETLDIADSGRVAALFERERFERVVHLAAQAGVRHSIDHPFDYGQSNLMGFLSVLEACRHARVAHLVYASSSSVYGRNARLPFAEDDRADTPVSLYGATKRANELMALAYAHLHRLPATGLRFFTVYGPWGRPDMAYWLFTRAILEGQPIDVFNGGRMSRDFTYVDDVVDGLIGALDRAPPDAAAQPPHQLFNVGNHHPETLHALIEAIESATGRRAQQRERPLPAGDVTDTFADTDRLARWSGFAPKTPLREGIGRFVDWYRAYHGG